MSTLSYPTGTIEVASGIYAYIQENCATNAGFIVTEEGVLVIDSLMTPSLAGALYTAIRNITSAPIRYLVNTHFHGDHVFGNQYFLPAPIVAHSNCRIELAEKFDLNMQRYREGRPDLIPELDQVRITLPDTVFDENMTIYLGELEIQLRYLGRAHSASDIFIHLPSEKLMFVGDIAVNKTLPAFPDGHITKWISVIKKAGQIKAETIIPGHGPIGGPIEFREAEDLLVHLDNQIRGCYDAGLSVEEAKNSIDLGDFDTFMNQDRTELITRMAYLAYAGTLE